MTINYTTLLGLAKPVTGTESGVWGDVVNDQITSLVEDAIANAASISVTAGNVTLTDNNGSSDQSRMAILLVTGSPGVSRNIVAPSTSKWYIVKNSSNAEIVLKGSATTGVTIPAGAEAFAFWNGSDFELAAMIGPSSSTDNAVARFDGTTGKVVQNSAVTIADTTGDITTGGYVFTAAGAVGTPAYSTSGDTNTGMWFPAADTIAFSEGGTEVMRINSSGNVGIGTDNPQSRLNVVSSAQTIARLKGGTGSAQSSALYIERAGSTATLAAFGDSAAILGGTVDQAVNIYADSGIPITFNQSTSERMRLDSSGNLGIGTSSPGDKLTVAAGRIRLDQDYQIVWQNAGTNRARIYGDSGNTIIFENGSGNTERMRITSGGDVGIGTTSPSSFGVLAVKKDQTADTAIAVSNTGTTNAATTMSFVLNEGGTAQGWLRRYRDGTGNTEVGFSDALLFTGSVTGTKAERARITSGGELLIGTTTDNGAYLLQVNSQIWATNATIATSDARLKDNIAPISGAIDTVKALQPVTFNFKQDTGYNFDAERQTGFIAQDLQTALAGQDYADCVVKECGPYLGVAYEKLIPVLTKAIQEQQAIIEQLTQRIAALESKGA